MKVKINEIELYYDTKGQGEPLIFIHGVGGSSLFWLPQIDPLSPYFKVLVYDLRGHGLSSIPPSGYSIRDHTEDLYLLLNRLELNKVSICGLSMGGMIAQEFALKYPERVNKLILAGTTPSVEYISKEVMEWFLRDAEIVEKNKTRALTANDFIAKAYSKEFIKSNEQIIKRVIERISTSPYEGYVQSVREMFKEPKWSVVNKLNRIKVPTLIVHGSKDEIIPIKAAEEIRRRIKNSKLIILDAGHAVSFERPTEFNKALIDFLKS